MTPAKIALIGDYSERHTAHRAIPVALKMAREQSGVEVAWEWVATRQISNPPRDLAGYAAMWVVPASPYENTEGVFEAIRWAREAKMPFLGTCGGFQHMLIEFARNAAGISGADHSETSPGGSSLVVTQLSCSMAEKRGGVHFAPGSLLGRAYPSPDADAEYNCNYGLNPAYRPALEAAGLVFTSWDDNGDIRGAELPSNPFYAGVLFQPERAALRGAVPPLVLAFVKAVASRA
jgi:CTP synthase (UTP-ammonia lyase)